MNSDSKKKQFLPSGDLTKLIYYISVAFFSVIVLFCFSFPITRCYTIINSRAFNSAKPIHSFTFSLPGPLLILFLYLVQLLWTFFSLASPLFRFINKISTLLSAHAKVTFSLSPPQHDDHEEEQPATATAQHHDIHSAPFFAYDVL